MVNGRIFHRRSDYMALSRFAFVASFGWIVDALILFGFVRLAGVVPGWANVASSLSAATLVYLVSHRQVHAGRPNAVPARLATYLAYTILLVLSISYLLQLLVFGLETMAPPAEALLAAKILVTPPQFFLNFVVSRFLATREGGLCQ